MPATVSHHLSATTPDDANYEIQPQHWNSGHDITLAISATEISGLFSNANGISFGLSNSSITASYTVPATGAFLTTAMASNRGSDFVQATAAFAGTSASGTIASGGISVSIGPYITTGALSGDTSKYVQNWKLTGNTAGTTSSAQGTDLWLQGGNSITVSGSSNSVVFSVGNYITTAMASNRGTDFVQATAAFAGTSASGTINSTGISVSIGPYLTTAMASNRGTDFVQATAAFAGTNASGTINSTGISVSVAAPGGGTTLSTYEPYPMVNTGTAAAGFATNTSALQSMFPFIVDAPVAAEYVKLAVTMSFATGGTSSFRQSGTWHWGLFTRPTGANNTRLSGGTTGSLSFALTYNNSTISISQATTTNSTGYGYLQTSSAGLNITSGYTGLKMLDLYLGTTLTPGQYWFGIHHRNSSSSFNSGLLYSAIGIQQTMSGMAPMGSFSSDYSTGTKIPLNIGGHWLMGNAQYTVAGLTQLTTDVTMSQMTLDRTFMPYMKFETRV